jgi:hypothetical protein
MFTYVLIKVNQRCPCAYIISTRHEEDVWGSEVIAPPLLTSALDGDGQFYTPAALPPRNGPQVPIGKGAG